MCCVCPLSDIAGYWLGPHGTETINLMGQHHAMSDIRHVIILGLLHMVPRRERNEVIVLIVEDEPFVRMGAVAIVESAGFVAIEAVNADQAVQIVEARTDIRIVTDIDMPGSVDRLKLAAAIRGRWPPIEIILTSGLHGRTG